MLVGLSHLGNKIVRACIRRRDTKHNLEPHGRCLQVSECKWGAGTKVLHAAKHKFQWLCGSSIRLSPPSITGRHSKELGL